MANKQTKSWSTSLVVKEMQVTTPVRHDLHPLDNTSVNKGVQRWSLHARLVGK